MWWLPGNQLVQDHSKRIDIRTLGHLSGPEHPLFRRHITRCTCQLSCRQAAGIRCPTKTKIEHQWTITHGMRRVGLDQDVLWLEISVHNPMLMPVPNRFGEVKQQLSNQTLVQWGGLLGLPLTKVPAVNVWHNVVVQPCVFATVKDGHNPGCSSVAATRDSR